MTNPNLTENEFTADLGLDPAKCLDKVKQIQFGFCSSPMPLLL
jgi:hypothetical protein